MARLRSTRRRRSGDGLLFDLLFGLFFVGFWSSMTLLFDGILVFAAAGEVQSLFFAHTPGQVTESRPVDRQRQDRDLQGDAQWVFAYEYQVNGQNYTGTRYDLNTMRVNDAHPAEKRMAQLTPGDEVRVYYAPHDPQQSVLKPGISAITYFMTLFMSPFNAVMLGGWWYLGSRVRNRLWCRPTGGLPITSDRLEIRVRLSNESSLAWAIGTVGAMGFAGVFLVGMPFMLAGGMPPTWLLASYWGVTLYAASYVFVRVRRRMKDPTRQLRIDLTRQTFVLPVEESKTGAARPVSESSARWPVEQRVISWHDIRTIEPAPVDESLDDDDMPDAEFEADATSQYAILLTLSDGESARVETRLPKGQADAFVAWLLETIGRPAETASAR